MRYNPAKTDVKPGDPFDLDEEFIHGVIQGPGGTCATMPVVYAAVGRRLGYPIRLVRAKSHLFARWDDPATGERFNIEGSSRGMHSHPDDHYRVWPYPINDEEERLYGYLESMSHREELAYFVARRAYRLLDAGSYREAVATFIQAAALDETHVTWPVEAKQAAEVWDRWLKAQRPPGFPKMEIVLNQQRQRWPTLPWELEKTVRFLEAAEDVLNDPYHVEQHWTPLREGKPPLSRVPSSITVDRSKE